MQNDPLSLTLGPPRDGFWRQKWPESGFSGKFRGPRRTFASNRTTVRAQERPRRVSRRVLGHLRRVFVRWRRGVASRREPLSGPLAVSRRVSRRGPARHDAPARSKAPTDAAGRVPRPLRPLRQAPTAMSLGRQPHRASMTPIGHSQRPAQRGLGLRQAPTAMSLGRQPHRASMTPIGHFQRPAQRGLGLRQAPTAMSLGRQPHRASMTPIGHFQRPAQRGLGLRQAPTAMSLGRQPHRAFMTPIGHFQRPAQRGLGLRQAPTAMSLGRQPHRAFMTPIGHFQRPAQRGLGLRRAQRRGICGTAAGPARRHIRTCRRCVRVTSLLGHCYVANATFSRHKSVLGVKRH